MTLQNNLLMLCKKNVAIVGLGRSGLAASKLIKKIGGFPILCDDYNLKLREYSIENKMILKSDLIILSPGVPRSNRVIKKAIKIKKKIVNEIDLASCFLPKCIFIGITGTNGKSTTVTLLSNIIETIESNFFLGGNIGIPLCEAVIKKQNPKFVILELSSYQLETISLLKLKIAALINLAPDHLDRYKNLHDYYKSKIKIFNLLSKNGTAIINGLDYNIKKYMKTIPQDFNLKNFNKNTSFSNFPKNILGLHNKINISCAISIAKALKISDQDIKNGLSKFKGLEHRLEFICNKNNITFINDSKATNVMATLTALNTIKKPIHIIVGGLGKNENYNPLIHEFKKNVKAVYTIGKEGPKLKKIFNNICKTFSSYNLSTATNQAIKNAKPGEIILLSPCCSSFDQFDNFASRGDQFKKLISNIT